MSSLVVAAIGIGGGVGLAGLAYRVIRPGFPVRVNCWFCQEWTSVPFGNRDCWDCPACEQYNGFDKDGGYNKDIPAQHRADLNHLTCDPSAVGQPSPSTSHLCDSCNRNQLLRVKQLAAFVPFNERNYDAEVSAYERHLEQVYRLCSLCAASTKYELKRQDRLLRTRMRPDERDRLQKSSQSALCTSHHDSENFASQRPLFSKAINVLSLLCAAWLLFVFLSSIQTAEVFKGNNLFPFLCAFRGHQPDSFTVSAVIFTGMFLDIFSKLVLGKVRIYLVDGLGCVSWLALLFCHLLRLQNPHNQSVLPMLIICAVTTGVEFFSLLQNRQPRSNPNISIRRLSLDSQNLNDSTSSRVTSSFTQNSSKLSDVTASASKTKYSQVTGEATDKFPWQEQFPWNRLQGPNLPGNGVPQRSAVAPSLFSEPVRRETTLGHQNESFALNSSFLSTLSEPLHDTKGFAAGLRHSSNSLFRLVGQKPSAEDRTFTTENLHHDLDLELDSINLGTTSMSNSSGIFSGYASVHTGEGRGDRLHSLRQRRPLISPAKLDTSRLSTSTPTGPGLFRRSAEQQRETDRTSRQSLFNLSVSDPWHGAELRRLSSSSNQDFRSSSVIGGGDQRAFCPVDSTTDNPSTKACPGPLDAGYGRLMTGVWAVLGFSVATNLTVLYLTLSKS